MKSIEVPTKLGPIGAEIFDSGKEYPGIQIYIKRPDGMMGLVLVEVDQHNDEITPKPTLKIHLYSTDGNVVDPIVNYHATEANFDQGGVILDDGN